MTKRLKKMLDDFFNNEGYDKMTRYYVPKLVCMSKENLPNYFITEENIYKDIYGAERQGFFRGYEYALIMLNMQAS